MFDQNYGNAKNTVQEEVNDKQSLVGESGKGRGRYLRQLYLLLSVQLLIGWWFTSLVQDNNQSNAFQTWVIDWSGFTFWTCLIIVIVLQLVGLVWRSLVSGQGLSWLWYTVHTFAFAFLFAYFEASNSPQNSLINYIFSLSFWVALSLFVHSLASKTEITFQSATLYILGAVYAVTLYHIIFSTYSLETSYLAAFGVTLFGFYLVWESETIIGQSSTSPSAADAFSGAYLVYTHIIILFLNAADMLRQLVVKERV